MIFSQRFFQVTGDEIADRFLPVVLSVVSIITSAEGKWKKIVTRAMDQRMKLAFSVAMGYNDFCMRYIPVKG